MRHKLILALALLTFAVFGVAFLSLNVKKVSTLGEHSLSTLELSDVNILYRDFATPREVEEIECERVKPVVYSNLDLSEVKPEDRKRLFINALLPSALIANYRVSQERENLLRILGKIEKGEQITELEKGYLEYLLSKYRAQSVEELLDKVMPVPVSLLLAQAAIESGWGRSRAFRVANNSFGMWTFKENAKHIRVVGTNIKLRSFENLLESVENYIYTLNVGWAYRGFRQKRFYTQDSLELADTMRFYSVQRERYVRKIKRLILANDLKRYDNCKLDLSFHAVE